MANYSGLICAAIMDCIQDYEAIRDKIGVSDTVMETLVGKLCGEGTLRRQHDHLTIANEGRAKILMESHRTNMPAAPIDKRKPGRPPSLPRDVENVVKEALHEITKPRTIKPDLEVGGMVIPADQVRRAQAMSRETAKGNVMQAAAQRPIPPTTTVALVSTRRRRTDKAVYDYDDVADGIVIETDVPVPEKGVRPSWKCPWPFAKLTEVGYSFAVPLKPGHEIKVLSEKIKTDALRYAKVHKGFRVKVATISETEVRVWRMPPKEAPAPVPVSNAQPFIRDIPKFN